MDSASLNTTLHRIEGFNYLISVLEILCDRKVLRDDPLGPVERVQVVAGQTVLHGEPQEDLFDFWEEVAKSLFILGPAFRVFFVFFCK